MTIVLGVILALVGLALWVFAGLLPVARILRTGEKGSASLQLRTTWMGSMTFAIRQVDGVRGVRTAQDPDAASGVGRKNEIEVRTAGEWQEFPIRFTQDAVAIGQFVVVFQQYLKSGGPRVLALPLRSRMNMMKRFLLFFPLGTASIFTGILLITG